MRRISNGFFFRIFEPHVSIQICLNSLTLMQCNPYQCLVSLEYLIMLLIIFHHFSFLMSCISLLHNHFRALKTLIFSEDIFSIVQLEATPSQHWTLLVLLSPTSCSVGLEIVSSSHEPSLKFSSSLFWSPTVVHCQISHCFVKTKVCLNNCKTYPLDNTILFSIDF